MDYQRLFAQFRGLYDGAVTGLCRVSPTGQVVSANPACCEMLGVESNFAETRTGRAKPVLMFVEPTALDSWVSAIEQCEGTLQGFEAELARQDGRVMSVSITAKALRDAGGAMRLIEASLQDITAQKKAVAEENKRHAAELASKAKSAFFSMVAHEIRTPMNAILTTADMALHTFQDAEALEIFNIIHRSGKSLISLLNDVLESSKAENGKLQLDPKPFRLREVLKDAMDIMNCNIGPEKNLTLKLEEDATLPDCLLGDSGRIRQCLINLIGNAIKFSKENSSVTLKVRRLEETLIFEIVDEGHGILPEDQHSLFRPYTQANSSTWRNFGGTGLGLYVVRQLVELMGGSVGVFSEGLGKGATFWFKVSLPELSYGEAGLSPPAPKASSGTLAARIAESAKKNNDVNVKRPRSSGTDPALVARMPMVEREKVKILVAEDSSTNRRVAKMLLKMLGFTAVYAEDGLLAVEAAEKEKFDVILMDLHMPGLDGVEAAQAIRASSAFNKETSIIAVTATADEDDMARILTSGMNGTVQKPIERKLLELALVNSLCPEDEAATDFQPNFTPF